MTIVTRKTSVITCLAGIVISSLASAEIAGLRDYANHQIVHVKVHTQAQLEELQASGAEVLNCAFGAGPVDVLVDETSLEVIRSLRLPHQVVLDDVNTWVDRQHEAARSVVAGGDPFADFFLAYHEYGDAETVGSIIWYLNELADRYPTLASIIEIGTTLEGRTIWGLRVTNDAIIDKPAVVYFGAEHAREWITTAVPPYIATYLLENYANDAAVRDLVDNVEFFLIPVMNVDGYVYSWTSDRFWRKNRRPNGGTSYGVDLNRNWGKGWGGPGSSSSSSSNTYRGPAPFSEPETQAMRDFFLAHPNIRAQIDFHNYSQLILWPNAFSDDLSPDHDLLEQIGLEMRALIYDVHNKIYGAGPTWDTLYAASGVSFDWTYYELGILSMTIECRDQGFHGFLLPAEQIIPQCEELMPAVLAYSNSDWVRAPAPPPIVSAAGSRYLSIQAQDHPADVAFRITAPDHPCLLHHATDAGYLVSTATFAPSDAWGTLSLGDAEIIPQTTYRVQAVYDGIGPSYPVEVTTGILGDVHSRFGEVDFADIIAMTRVYLGAPNSPPWEWCDLLPSVPDGIVDFQDLQRAVDSFQGVPSWLTVPCPAPE